MGLIVEQPPPTVKERQIAAAMAFMMRILRNEKPDAYVLNIRRVA